MRRLLLVLLLLFTVSPGCDAPDVEQSTAEAARRDPPAEAAPADPGRGRSLAPGWLILGVLGLLWLKLAFRRDD